MLISWVKRLYYREINALAIIDIHDIIADQKRQVSDQIHGYNLIILKNIQSKEHIFTRLLFFYGIAVSISSQITFRKIRRILRFIRDKMNTKTRHITELTAKYFFHEPDILYKMRFNEVSRHFTLCPNGFVTPSLYIQSVFMSGFRSVIKEPCIFTLIFKIPNNFSLGLIGKGYKCR